jgi:ADP-ribosylglycohydrolase
MRVSPVGFAFGSSREVLEQAKKSAEVTHNHPEGIKGAQALALAVFLAKQGSEKREIQQTIEDKFDYDLSEPVEEIRRVYTFDVSCQGSVPQALRCFLESEDFEDAIRKAVSIGGDSDTIACMAGAVSQAYFREIPEHIVLGVRARLNEAFLAIIEEFEGKLAL